MPKKIKLPNQVRLVLVPHQEALTASLLILVKVGSRQESQKISGASHFIEHLMFKGTKKRPTTLDLSKELDGVGADFNAFTGKDYTGYYIKSDAKNLSLAIDILSDMLLHSKLEKSEIEREKGVIVEEINMYEDNPIMYIDDLLEQTMYDHHPLGRSIAGTRETVKKMSRSDLINYKNKFYTGRQIVICLSGNFTDSHLKELKTKFKFKPSVKNIPIESIRLKQNQPRLTLKFKETEQTQIALGFPAYAYADKRIYALQLLAVILGGNMSSRLFLSVRERNGLAYFIRSFLSVYEDTGALIIQAGLDKTRVEKALKLIVAKLKKIKQGVTAVELKRAKEYIFGKTALDLEDTAHLAQWYGQQELMLCRLLTPEEKKQKITAVTQKDIKIVAQDIIKINKASLAIIGPFKDSGQFKNILK